LRAYIADRVTSRNPDLNLSMDPIRPTLTAGLKTDALDLTRDGVRLLHMDDVRVTPDLLKLIGNRRQGRFFARWAQGTVDGLAAMPPDKRAWRMEADIQGVRLEKLDLPQALHADDQFALAGVLNGRLTHEGGNPPQGTSNGALTLNGLSVALSTPVAGIDNVVIDKANVEFSVKSTTLQVKTVTFDGPMLEGRISGVIQFKTPVGQSRLNLSGNAKPRPELIAKLQETLPSGLVNMRSMGNRGLPFRIRGTIDNPDVAMR
jgi:type II secretion system protein N